MNGKRTFVVGIAGASASGKSTLALRVSGLLGDAACCIGLDCYYRNLDDLDAEERAVANFDAPEAFDWPLLLDHVNTLVAGRPVPLPDYDFATHLRRDSTEIATPKSVLLVEGIHALSHPPLLTRLDLKVFVDTPQEICFIRRLERDIAERGRAPASVIAQYRATVRPMYLRHVAPARATADLVVSGEDCERGAETVVAAITARLGD